MCFSPPFPEEEISDYIAHGPIIRVLTVSLYDNKSAVEKLGVAGGRTKNASCSDLGDENASYSEPRDLQSRGTCWDYACWEFPGPWVASTWPPILLPRFSSS